MFGLSSYDLIWSIGALGVLAVTFAALFVWFRARWERSWEAGLTLLAIVVVPVLGPLAFLASRLGRGAEARSSDRAS